MNRGNSGATAGLRRLLPEPLLLLVARLGIASVFFPGAPRCKAC